MPNQQTVNPADAAPSRLLAASRVSLVAASSLMVLLFLVAAWLRLHFSFEFDWIEDGMLASVRHIGQGQPLYQAPSVSFTPYLYTPVYLYLAAAVAKVTGASYGTLRLVSLLSTLGTFAVIYGLVYSEVRRHIAAVAAVGLFAACYPLAEACFDLGRVDMLYLLFVAAALFATRRLHPVVAGLLWVLAFQTKQGVLPIAFLALIHDWQRPRRVVMGLGSYAVLLASSILLLEHGTHGWYRYYVFGMAGGFGISLHQAIRFLPSDLLAPFGLAFLIIFAALVLTPPRLRSSATSFYVMGTLGMVCFTGYLRAHRGANVNALVPAYLWISLVCGICMARLYKWIEAHNTRYAATCLSILLMAATLQMVTHLYSPREFAQTDAENFDRMAFERQLRAISGEVLVLSHPEDGLMAGKQLYAGSESVGAVIDAKNRKVAEDLRAQYAELIHSRRLTAIALDLPQEVYDGAASWKPADFGAYYPIRIAAEGADSHRFSSVPQWLYFACPGDGHVDPRQLFPGAAVDESGCH